MLNFKNSKKIIILFLMPALAFYLCLEIYPAFRGIFLSFYKWKGIGGSEFKFYGLNNYFEVFKDPVFLLSIRNLMRFLIVSLITQLPIALLIGYLLSLGLKGTRFFKITFYLPMILSVTAISLLWKLILAANYGLLNSILTSVGLEGLTKAWLTDPSTSFNSIILINSWIHVGFYMVILLAAILGIPEDIFEALKLDGANGVVVFFKIIIPLVREMIGVCIVLIMTQTMKTFDLIYVLTSGTFGPNDINQVPIGLMYYKSFIGDNFGNGSAISTLVLIFGVTISAIVYMKVFKENTSN
ncbi:MAG TPA: sugar ABC transporter permease [Ruminiclostridium sp.]